MASSARLSLADKCGNEWENDLYRHEKRLMRSVVCGICFMSRFMIFDAMGSEKLIKESRLASNQTGFRPAARVCRLLRVERWDYAGTASGVNYSIFENVFYSKFFNVQHLLSFVQNFLELNFFEEFNASATRMVWAHWMASFVYHEAASRESPLQDYNGWPLCPNAMQTLSQYSFNIIQWM